MKKNILILALALLIALPVFGLAAEAATAPAEETQTVTPYGGQYGRRWNQNPETATQMPPQAGFVDENGDGACDLCGNEQDGNAKGPNFTDADGNGVCDHFGTGQQGRMNARMQSQRGFGRGMMARGGRQMQGRGAQGNAQGRNFLDSDNDGTCDNFSAGGQRNFGRGRNRR